MGIDVTPYPPKSDRQLSQFAVKIRNFENFKLGTDFEKAHPSAAVSRIDGSGFPVNVPSRECGIVPERPIANIRHVGHSARMTVARAFFLEALQRVADGGDVAESELDTAVPDPFALDRAEKIAWEELSHWADDDDIRERDERYTAAKRKRLRDHVAALRSNGR